MAITKNDVLQKVNIYCAEKQYTLDDSFKDKFSEKFATANPGADVKIDDVVGSINFNLDTAFSAVSKGLETANKAWNEKESDYKKQLEEAKKSLESNKGQNPKKGEEVVNLPEEVTKALKELTKFKEQQVRADRKKNVLELAKKDVRSDLYGDLEETFNIMNVDYGKKDEEIAKNLTETFSKLFKGKIGNILPQSPETTRDADDALLKSVKHVEI